MANYYLGFNGWSTEIVYSRVEETSGGGVKGSASSPLRVKYGAALRLTVPGFYVDGVGLSEETVGASGLAVSCITSALGYIHFIEVLIMAFLAVLAAM